MPFCRRGHVFHAVVNDFHGLARLDGKQGGVPRDHRRVFFFSAEGASGFHLDDADFVFGETAEGHQRFVDVVGALQGAPDGDSTLRLKRSDHAVVFDVQLLLLAGEIFAFYNMRGVSPDSIHVALFDQVFLEGVVGTPDDVG